MTTEGDTNDEIPVSCILESFLRDMHELDCHQGVATPDYNLIQVQGNIEVGVMLKPAKSDMQAQTGTSMAATNRRIGSWLRHKKELWSLRQQSQELETRVILLQHEKERKQVELLTGSIKEHQKWKLTATRQKEGLQRAKDENEALKHRLRRYVEYLKEAQTIIASASFELGALSSSLRSAGITECRHLQLSSSDTFNMLQVKLN